jgi:hypothetical protein
MLNSQLSIELILAKTWPIILFHTDWDCGTCQSSNDLLDGTSNKSHFLYKPEHVFLNLSTTSNNSITWCILLICDTDTSLFTILDRKKKPHVETLPTCVEIKKSCWGASVSSQKLQVFNSEKKKRNLTSGWLLRTTCQCPAYVSQVGVSERYKRVESQDLRKCILGMRLPWAVVMHHRVVTEKVVNLMLYKVDVLIHIPVPRLQDRRAWHVLQLSYQAGSLCHLYCFFCLLHPP